MRRFEPGDDSHFCMATRPVSGAWWPRFHAIYQQSASGKGSCPACSTLCAGRGDQRSKQGGAGAHAAPQQASKCSDMAWDSASDHCCLIARADLLALVPGDQRQLAAELQGSQLQASPRQQHEGQAQGWCQCWAAQCCRLPGPGWWYRVQGGPEAWMQGGTGSCAWTAGCCPGAAASC